MPLLRLSGLDALISFFSFLERGGLLCGRIDWDFGIAFFILILHTYSYVGRSFLFCFCIHTYVLDFIESVAGFPLLF